MAYSRQGNIFYLIFAFISWNLGYDFYGKNFHRFSRRSFGFYPRRLYAGIDIRRMGAAAITRCRIAHRIAFVPGTIIVFREPILSKKNGRGRSKYRCTGNSKPILAVLVYPNTR